MLLSDQLSKLSAEYKFMISALLVNIGNYIYNLLLGRLLGPELFAEAALLLTLVLVLSFIGMTFQLVTAKFAVVLEGKRFSDFMTFCQTRASIVGCILGVLMGCMAPNLRDVFRTQSPLLFVIFGIGIPVYFVMSVNRGKYQGQKSFAKLALTYQTEMLSKLSLTLLMVYLLPISPITSVAIGLVLSFFLGLIPFSFDNFCISLRTKLSENQRKPIRNFFLLTAFYELTQILINNSDILLVKHYFEDYYAGIYASLALIGRVVYFIAWMFVMLLFPKVLEKQKQGKPTTLIFFRYLGIITGLSLTIILGCLLFPDWVVLLMFGADYLEIAPLVWKYALATSLFAISNVFAYYFLSLDRYIPVLLSGILGIAQLVSILYYHSDLDEVVHMQILWMALLLAIQILYFLWKKLTQRDNENSSLAA